MLIDTHAHVNFSSFRDDGDEVIRRALAEDTWMILVGSEYKTSKRALDLANKYEKGVYAAVGLHLQVGSQRSLVQEQAQFGIGGQLKVLQQFPAGRRRLKVGKLRHGAQHTDHI